MAISRYLKGCHMEEGEVLVSFAPEDRTRSSEQLRDKFSFDGQERFFFLNNKSCLGKWFIFQLRFEVEAG